MAIPLSSGAVWVPIVRYVQIVLSLLLFILGIVCVAEINFNDPAVTIVTGIFGLAYYIPLVLPVTVSYISPAISLGGEIWLTIWWIVSLGVTANDFGNVPCTALYFYGSWKTGCQVGKALIAFSVIGFIISLITLGLVSFYSIHPIVSKDTSGKAMLARNAYALGGIFLVPGFETAAAVDLEKGPEADAAGVDALATPAAPVDNATNRTQSTEGIKEPEHFSEPVDVGERAP